MGRGIIVLPGPVMIGGNDLTSGRNQNRPDGNLIFLESFSGLFQGQGH
jgi:hypothetical protein